LSWARAIYDDQLDPTWAERGEELLLLIRGAVHGELDPVRISQIEPEVRHWRRHGRDLESEAVAAGDPPIKRWLEQRG